MEDLFVVAVAVLAVLAFLGLGSSEADEIERKMDERALKRLKKGR